MLEWTLTTELEIMYVPDMISNIADSVLGKYLAVDFILDNWQLVAARQIYFF